VSGHRRWWAPGAGAAAGLVVAAVAASDVGLRGAGSAALGTALVLLFLGSGLLPLLLIRGQESSDAVGFGVGVLLLNYTLRLAVALVVLQVASRSESVEPAWTAYAVIATALVWTTAQAVAVLGPGTRDPDPAPDGSPDRPGSGRGAAD
jgi:ATP synthase protein I